MEEFNVLVQFDFEQYQDELDGELLNLDFNFLVKTTESNTNTETRQKVYGTSSPINQKIQALKTDNDLIHPNTGSLGVFIGLQRPTF